jgi:hypothetical protein
VDSTGIKVEGEGEWHTRKHGGSKRRVWRKIHLGIDEETLEIRGVEVTSSNVGDAPMLPDLLVQIPAEEEIATVTADGAYDTRACHDAIAARDAAAFGHSFGPVAVMPSLPPRRNARLWKPDTAGARTRNEILRASKHLGRIRRAYAAPPGPRSRLILAELERVSLQQQGRDKNELREAARPTVDVAGL